MKCEYPSSEAEWLKLRRPRINSTESAALFGFSPYMTAYEVGVEKRLGHGRDVESERTKWGQRLQGVIADAFEEEQCVRVERADHRYFMMDGARVGATIDYIIKDTFGDTREVARRFVDLGPGVLEIKNVDKFVFMSDWTDGDPPIHIEMQLQHQLATTGLKWGCVFVLVGGNTPHLVIREADPKVAAAIVQRSEEFWNDFERGKLPDPFMPADAKTMCMLYGIATPGKVYDANGDTTLADLAAQYLKHRQNAKDADDAASVCKAHILERIGENEKVSGLTGYNISAKMVAEAHIEYDREEYRAFRVTERKR